jgi:hypothetical protein
VLASLEDPRAGLQAAVGPGRATPTTRGILAFWRSVRIPRRSVAFWRAELISTVGSTILVGGGNPI